MTVAELIAALQALPQDALVVVRGVQGDCDEPYIDPVSPPQAMTDAGNKDVKTLRLAHRIGRSVMVNGVWRPATGPNMDAALMEAIERIVIDDDLSAFAAGLDAIREGNA